MAALPGQAADLRPSYKAAPVVAAPSSWTGIYIGGHVGAGWGTKEYNEFLLGLTEFDSSHTVNGVLAGAQIGANWQSSWMVFGVEVDGSWANLRGRGNCSIVGAFNCSTRVDALGTATVRFGAAIDHALIYVKGGAAWARDRFTVSDPIGLITSSVRANRSGYTVGTGVEYALGNSWSAKIEYDYMDFGTRRRNFPVLVVNPLFDNWDIVQRVHTIKFGLNYRLDWGGPVSVRF
jgi:opacity protein-like surface antigen